jgi:8-oxo-dGDP phosphatase
VTTSIRRLSSRVVYENPWLRLREDEIERPDPGGGRVRGVYAVVEKEDFAVVVPWDGRELTLVGQERYTLGRYTWEFPQGGVAGATPEERARTELAEETGLRAGALRHLGHLDNAVGMSSQGYDVWLATDLTEGEPAPEAEEVDMRTRRVAPEEFERMVRDGELTDGSSVAAWALLALEGGLPA